MSYIGSLFRSQILFIFLGFLPVLFFVLSYYGMEIFRNRHYSPASELTAILVYFLGVLTFLGQLEIAIILAITLSFITGAKQNIENIMDKISREEVYNTLKFAVIAFMILPLLPDQKFSFQSLFSAFGADFAQQISHPIWTVEFFNPYSLWLFVVVMSGISYLGYILTKIIGSTSGILLSSVI